VLLCDSTSTAANTPLGTTGPKTVLEPGLNPHAAHATPTKSSRKQNKHIVAAHPLNPTKDTNASPQQLGPPFRCTTDVAHTGGILNSAGGFRGSSGSSHATIIPAHRTVEDTALYDAFVLEGRDVEALQKRTEATVAHDKR
jgi:hypothetical protein